MDKFKPANHDGKLINQKTKEMSPKYESKPRIDVPNTPSGHSDKIRQTDLSQS